MPDYKYKGEVYSEEEIIEAAEKKEVSFEDYITKFDITKIEDIVKPPTTTPGAGVEAATAPNTELNLTDSSLELPSTDVTPKEIKNLSYRDRQRIARSGDTSRNFVNSLSSSYASRKKEVKKNIAPTIIQRINDIPQIDKDKEFENLYFKLDERPFRTQTVANLPGQSNIKQEQIPIEEYLSPEKYSQYQSILNGNGIIPTNDEEAALISNTREQARINLAKKATAGYLNTLPQELVDVYNSEKINIFDKEGKQDANQNLLDSTVEMRVQNNENIDIYNTKRQYVDDELKIINDQINILKNNADFDNTGRQIENSTPATIVEYNKLVSQANEVITQYKNSELNVFAEDIMTQSELINSNIKQYQENNRELTNQNIISKALEKDYTFGAAAGMAFEDFIGGGVANIGFMAAELGLEGLKNIKPLVNIVAGPVVGTALNKLVDFDLNDLNKDQVDRAITFVQKQAVDYNKKLADKREKTIPEAFVLDDIGKNDVEFFDWFTRASADNSPSMLVSFIPGVAGLRGASALTTGMTFAQRKAALISQKAFTQSAINFVSGTFFVSETGGKYGDIVLDAAKAKEQIPFLQEQLRETENLEQRSAIQADIDDLIRQRDYTLAQKAFTSLAFGTTAMFAERFGQTQMMTQGRSFIKNIGTKEAKKSFYNSYAKYITNTAGKAVFQGTSTMAKAVGINVAEESLTLIGQNSFDIMTLGEDKSILDGLNKDFFAQNVVASFGLAAPQLAGGTMNVLKNEFRSYSEIQSNQKTVRALISNQKSIDNFSGDKRKKAYVELKNKKNSLIQDLGISDAMSIQKLNSMSIGQMEEAADIQRQLRIIKGEARSLGTTGLVGQDVTDARQRLETQYKGLFKQLESLLNTKKKNIRGKVTKVAQELGVDFVNTNADYHFGLLDFMNDAALVMQGENGSMIQILDSTTNADEALEKFTPEQREKILSARERRSNATFIGEDIIIFSDNVEFSIGQTLVNADGKYAATAAIHELFHINNIKKGLIDKDGNLSEQGKKAVDEAVAALVEKKALGRVNISDKDYESLINRIESYKKDEDGNIQKGASEEALIALSDAAMLGMLDINDFNQNLPSLKGYIQELTNDFFGNNSYLMQLNSASDVFKFIKNYQKEVEVRQISASDPLNEDGEIMPNKNSKGIATLFEGIQKLVPSDIKTKEEFSEFIRDPKKGRQVLDAIINEDGAIQRYVRKNQTSQEQGDKTIENIQDRILNFDPQATRKTDGKAVGIEAFTERVMSDAMFGKMDANKELAKESEKSSQETSLDNPDANTQLADNANIDSKIDNTPKQQTSKLRRDLGIKQGDDTYNVVKKIAKEIFGKDLPDTKIRAFVNKAAKNEKELIKNIQNLISTEKAIDQQFLNKNILKIIDNLSLQDLAKLQRGVKQDVFVEKVKKLTKGAEVDQAIKDKKLPQGTSRTSNPILYERLPVTLEQAKEFFQGKEGNESSKRKVGLVGVLVENLTKEAAPEVTKELVEEGKMTPAQRAKVLDDINKDPELKFSRGIKNAINSIPSSKRQEVVDKFGDFAENIKKGFSVDASINIVFGFLNDKQKKLFSETIKPEIKKIVVNQKNLETGKPKEVDIVKFLTDAVDEVTRKEVTKKTLGLGPKSLNFKNKFQLYGYFNLIDQFIESKIRNMDNDFDKAFYIVNTFAPTLTAAAKVSDGSLTWEKINDLPTLINKKTGNDKDSLRYSLFANNGQMGEVLIKPFLKNPELLVFKNSQLLYNGKKLFNTRVSQTVSPALTSIKKTGKLNDDLLDRSQAYSEQNTNAVIELATFFKELKDTDAGLSMNDFGMFLQGANGDMSAMIRAAAKLDSVAGLNDNLSLNPENWRFEHNPPARTMQVHLANYIQGNITEAQLREEFDNYTVSIIPKLMDDVINERYQDTSPLNSTSKWQRYYNEYSFGRFPYATTVYKSTKDGKYTTEEVGKFAPAAYKSVQTAEIKNKKELAPVFKFSKSTPVDNQQVLDKMAEIDNENLQFELKESKGIDLSRDMNDIIQNKTGIASEKTYSRIKGEVVGASKGKFDFFIPPSAEDFTGLLYKTLGKGKLGDSQMAWYKAHLLNPYAGAMDNITKSTAALMNDFKVLKEDLKVVPKTLKKKILGESFTQEQAVRVNVWTKQGMTVPGLSQTDTRELNDFVESKEDLVIFADQLIAMQKGDKYAAPGEGWLAGNITTDLMDGVNTVKRAKYLEVWQSNVDQIFSEANLNKLEAAYGKDYRLALENSLQRMKTGKNRSFGGDTLTGRVTDWLTNSIGAIMFFNTRSAVLQTISAINFINFGDNNIYAAGKAFANQPQYWKDFKMLFNSDFLMQRRDGLKLNVNEADIADMAKKDGVRGVISELLRLGFLPTQLADSFAIASGGSTFYRNRLKALEKQGMSKKDAEAQAFQDFRETAEESQQSSRPDRISQQQAGPLGRVILAFANTPAQYARIIKKAASDLKNGRGDAKTNISKILYYGVAQNLIFNALQQALFGLAFGDDEEELTEKEKNKKEKRYVNVANGMADSLLRGAGLGGAVFSVLKNVALRLNQESDKKSPKYQDVLVKEILQISPPISSKVGKLRAAGRSYSWNRKEMMEKGWSLDNPAYLAAGQVIAATTNIPLDRAFKKIDNIRNASNSDLEAWQRIASAAGWSAWELGIKKPKTNSNKLKPEKIKFNKIKIEKINMN